MRNILSVLAGFLILVSSFLVFAPIGRASTPACTSLGTACGSNQNSQTYGWAAASQVAAYNNPVVTVWNGTTNEALDWYRTSPSAGVYRYEYAPNGVRSGLCAADPNGGYPGDPGGPNGIVERTCNTGNFQLWRDGTAGTGGKQLVNVASGKPATPRGNNIQMVDGGTDIADSYWSWIAGSGPPPPSVLNSKTLCAYTNSISGLNSLSTSLGKTVSCAEIFANSDGCWLTGGASPCDPYSSWVDPWYAHGTGDSDWNTWIRADSTRRVVISHNLVPLDISQDMGDGKYNPNWRADCANGVYSQYYPTLATNLVNAGFGHAVIRLGHEMNGDWYSGALGSDSTQYANWAACFAKIVTGMRSVAGANFLFDWNVNQGYRNIPFASYYPGDAYVDVMGMDAYDSGMPGNPQVQPTRWNAEYPEGGGLSDFISFANSHSKPLSLPEWGLVNPPDGINDDPYYVQQIAGVIASNNFAYQSYFDTGGSGIPTIQSQPNSWAAYKAAFGPGGTVHDSPW